MRYKTTQGVEVEIGRLPRKAIDDFVLHRPPPMPPVREVVAFGGVKETLEYPDDPAYQRELALYYLALGREQLELLAPAITVLSDWKADERYIEMRGASIIPTDTYADYLRYVALDSDDFRVVVDEIFYLSTTTDRGVEEATEQFNVTWNGAPLDAWRITKTPGKFSRLFEDREAALFGGHTWQSFIELTGPEQSAIVAHRRQRIRLDNLMQQERATK